MKSGYEQERARAERLQAVSDEREKSIEMLKEELKHVRADKECEFARLELALKGKEKAKKRQKVSEPLAWQTTCF